MLLPDTQRAAVAEERMECDLALVNGQIVDPELRVIYEADVAVIDGKIAAIDRVRGRLNGRRILDAAGAYVTPALVDCHVHCYEHVSPGSLNPDRIGVKQGVGAVIDAGSFGPRNAG